MNKKNKIENLCNHPSCKEEGVYKAPLDYDNLGNYQWFCICLLYTSPSPRDKRQSRMPSSA